MAARAEEAAADARAVSARFPFREIVAIIAVVFTATGAMLAGMQWTVSNNVAPLFLVMQRVETQVVSLREAVAANRTEIAKNRAEIEKNRAEIGALRGLRGEVAELRGLPGEVAELRAEVVENRRQITDLRERVAKVETGLEQVQANQVRMLEILERRPHPRE